MAQKTDGELVNTPSSPSLPGIDNEPLSPKSDSNANNKIQSMIAWLKTFRKFAGPGYMVAVGYLDPGNWATDLSAGSLVSLMQ